MMNGDVDDVRLGCCPRCGHVDPYQTRPESDFILEEEITLEEDEYRSAIFGKCFALKQCSVCGLGGATRSHIKGGYSRRDLLEVVDDLPMMGRPCYHCGARLPKFLDLSHEDHARIYKLARSAGEEIAVDALVELMSCPREWARLWVTHPFGPRRPARVWVGPPCSQCGRPLRTRLARQCFECGKDWHDPDNIRQLK